MVSVACEACEACRACRVCVACVACDPCTAFGRLDSWVPGVPDDESPQE